MTLNALAIIVFLKGRRLSKRSMYLTISLTVADKFNPLDFFSGNDCNISTIYFVSNPNEITGALLLYFLAVSVTNLAAISLGRMHATFCPFKHRLTKKKVSGAAVAAVCCVWFTVSVRSILLILIMLYFYYPCFLHVHRYRPFPKIP